MIYKGVVSTSYRSGQTIKIKVQLTANHKGAFQYQLCLIKTRNGAETEGYFRQHLLKRPSDERKFPLLSSAPSRTSLEHEMILPENVAWEEVSHCILR